MTRKFIVTFNNRYLVKTPYWSTGKWSDKKEDAHIFTAVDGLVFFPMFYPQFTVIEIT